MRVLLVTCLLLVSCGRERVTSDPVLVCGDCAGDAHGGDCVPACAGQCAGGDDGCGGTCSANDCRGCCDDTSICVLSAAQSDTTCGVDGRTCVDCSTDGRVCDHNTYTCFDPCVVLPADDCNASRVGELRCGGALCSTGIACVQTCRELPTCHRWITTEACSDTCVDGQCCDSDCAGQCAGGPDGCGGICATNTCAGCCDAELLCVALESQSDDQCGANGDTCTDCDATSGICRHNECCTPSCAGSCAGTPDGCGGTCPTSQCVGCCTTGQMCMPPESQSNSVCGSAGESCSDCDDLGRVCHENNCCEAACSGRCPGAADDCGGTCADNDCSGCCTGTTCVAPAELSDQACGANGEDCTNCSTNSRVCFEDTCCAPDCAGKCRGADDGCGGTCPYASCSGCCNSEHACVPLAAQSNNVCGHGGGSCSNCTATSRACFGGYCCVSYYGQSCSATCHTVLAPVLGYSQYEDVWCVSADKTLYSITNCGAVDPDPCTTNGEPAGCGLIPGYQWCDVRCNYYYDCTLSYSCSGSCG